MNIDEHFSEKVLMLVVASILGAISTLLVQWGYRIKKKKQLKKVVKSYLSDSILPICEHLREEIDLVKKSLLIHHVNISLDTHPQLNSLILKSFGTTELLIVFKENATSIVDIIGIIDHLGTLRPRDVMDEYIDSTYAHVDDIEHEDFEDNEEHFLECRVMKEIRSQTETQLVNISNTIDHLERHIKTII